MRNLDRVSRPAAAPASWLSRLGPVVAVVTAALAGVLAGLGLTAAAPVSGIAQVDTAVRVGLPLARATLDLAAVAAVGFALFPLLAGQRAPASAAAAFGRARTGVAVAAVVWAVAALVSLVLQAAEYRPSAPAVSFADLRSYVATVAAGKALLVVAGFALVQAALAVAAQRLGRRVPPELVVGCGLFALLPLPVTGHAATSHLAEYTMVLLELHIVSAVAWTGGLAAVVVLAGRHRGLLAVALPRFSRLATACLAVTVATGALSGLVEFVQHPTVEPWPGIVTTTYGHLLLAKIVALGAIAALGGYTRWKLLPGVVRHRRTALTSFALVELAVLGLALGIAAVLTRTPLTTTT
ncbi:copper resistance protein CopD [Saccharomonospora piscinae]|uniref:Copper resistance protein CopD n=1 Tax=Saccharomonospora piscinae TaxID=687388 RepID=A0A1V9A0Y8_SACPI|nr:CopD family protein [Saccharomonospora piscinae]OQO90751.1 copper resistance protein CopD [Saccharomonospora piscinae]TLW93424.1 copper resistance protein CopD [Saccharomonospora piscinae]